MMYYPLVKDLSQHQIYKIPEKEDYVFPIPKNGYSTLNRVYKEKNWERHALGDISSSKQREITVFIREPLDRFFSAVVTAFRNEIKEEHTEKIISMIVGAVFIDRHLFPQLFYLMRLHDSSPDSYLTFKSYKDIGEVLDTDIHVNFTDTRIRDHHRQVLRSTRKDLKERLEHVYFPDTIIWNEFLDQRIHFDTLRERIGEEKEYFNDYVIGKGF